YFVPFLLFPALTHAKPATWLATAVGGVAFLVLYFSGYWLCGRRVLWSAGGLAALAAIFGPSNPASSSFWIFAAAALPEAGPPAFVLRWLAALLAAIAVESWVFHLPPWYWGPAALFSLMIGGIKIHQTELRRADASLRLAHEEVERLAKVA